MLAFIKKLVEPNDPKDRRLYRCSCGSLFWSNSSQEIRRKHDGHRFSLCINGSAWEFFKLKMGWIK